MKNMTLENIAKACGGTYIGSEEERKNEIKGAVTDSRQVEEGYLFIPIKGARVDGHDFIPKVMEQGAAATLSEKELTDCKKPYILVKSSEQALKDIAEFYREQLTIPIVGITGSVGKTSTKEMIASVLSQKFKVLKTAGNFNNEIGLPLTLLRIREEHEVAVVEMGISDFGEMHRLAKMAKPDVCVMTNIGICHLENLKTRDGILKAKSEIFDFLKPDGHIVLNRKIAQKNHYPAIDVLASISRCMSQIATDEHKKLAGHVKNVMATYAEAEDLINIGAYKNGSNKEIDEAIQKIGAVNQFLMQDTMEKISFEDILKQLEAIFA